MEGKGVQIRRRRGLTVRVSSGKGRHATKSKWVCTIKYDAAGEVEKFEAKFFAME
jgi:hypothetical protein